MGTDTELKNSEPQTEEIVTETVEDTLPPVSFVPVSSFPTQKMPTTPQLMLALGALALVFLFSYLPIGTERNEKKAEQTVERVDKEQQTLEAEYFKETSVSANAAYVWDVKNRKALYNKNAGTQLPLASLTKLMTVLVAYEHLDAKEKVAITQQALMQEGDSKLTVDETFAMHDLADLTLVTSSNDGAYALAAAAGEALHTNENATQAFVDAMNIKAGEIGVSQLYFTNPTGLDLDGITSGSYGSARDVAFLMEHLVLNHPEILEATKEPTSVVYNQEGTVFKAVNTNEVVSSIPGLIASKTGFTSLAGGNLVVAYDVGLNRPIIITVLGSTREGRFSDVLTLIKETARMVADE